MQCAELTQRLVPLLEALPDEVVSVYLFGSFARDEANPRSDVDLAFSRLASEAMTDLELVDKKLYEAMPSERTPTRCSWT